MMVVLFTSGTEFLWAIETSRVVLVIGEAGSGKSTRGSNFSVLAFCPLLTIFRLCAHVGNNYVAPIIQGCFSLIL